MTNFKSDMVVTYFKVILQHFPGMNEGSPKLIIGPFLMTDGSHSVYFNILA
jgi:hypothetical protein